MSYGKSIKGAGSFSLEVVPRKNYLNAIFPNDVVNIYVDPGDGDRGFVRVMLGYVDRVELSESTNEDGSTNTIYRISGSDFQKAFDQTEIYFNPHLANRTELLDPRFGMSLLAQGSALRTRGLIAHGTPADMVENLLTLLMGFGQQWVLPSSYPTGYVESRRNTRKQRASTRIPNTLASALQTMGYANVDQLVQTTDIEQAIRDKFKQLTGVDISDTPPTPAITQSYISLYQAASSILEAKNILSAYQTIAIDANTANPVSSILDLCELGFIETMTIDGYIASAGVWTSQGTLASIIAGYSNEIVNELCYDLRPIVNDSADGVFGSRYSKEPDELGINVKGMPGFEASVAAIEYRPAVVMREYPYSVVEGLDLTRYNVLDSPVGFVPFGPIFAQDPNPTHPSRKLFRYNDTLTPEACLFSDSSSPMKHLDVIPITDGDVIQSSIGRSDHDIFNLFAIYSNDGLNKIWKFLIQDILPIVTPISIVRNGLRVKEVNTKFANYSRDRLCNGSSGVDTGQIRRNLIRWALLLDHWNQHNIEYLSGTLTLRSMPEIRVGYRLDWIDKNMSYYVEQVQGQWKYPGPLYTTVQVSRGQRNDPYPAYIPPMMAQSAGGLPAGAPPPAPPSNFDVPTAAQQREVKENQIASSASVAQQGGGNRSSEGRLAKFFPVMDERATAFSPQGERRFGEGNEMDRRPNADAGQRAEYAQQLADRDNPNPSGLDDLGRPNLVG
jgi:hypothetical protein